MQATSLPEDTQLVSIWVEAEMAKTRAPQRILFL